MVLTTQPQEKWSSMDSQIKRLSDKFKLCRAKLKQTRGFLNNKLILKIIRIFKIVIKEPLSIEIQIKTFNIFQASLSEQEFKKHHQQLK
jgi:hypothetical protein